MRDRRKKAVEVIDSTRMDMAGVEGMLKYITESKGDIVELKEMVHSQRMILKSLRKGLNKPMFDDQFASPFGFDLRDE
jgi:hypothetical protein|tara:strand:- start:303 stop:536 length:234 start_codon:yes stop_codon:yes gene_type:complete